MQELVPEGRSLEEVFVDLVAAVVPEHDSGLPAFIADSRAPEGQS